MLDRLLVVIACSIDVSSGVPDRDDCIAFIEVVGPRSECKERLDEIKLTLPANLVLQSFPECAKDRRQRVQGRYLP